MSAGFDAGPSNRRARGAEALLALESEGLRREVESVRSAVSLA